MGTTMDLKFFVKRCHQYGIRVQLDVVMNHSRECPLEQLAHDWSTCAMMRNPSATAGEAALPLPQSRQWRYLARDFQYNMAKFWIGEYHVDGFRLDDSAASTTGTSCRNFTIRPGRNTSGSSPTVPSW